MVIQNTIGPSGYVKDHTKLDEYIEKATFLPYLNNEKDHPRANMNKKKFEQLNSLYMVRFLRDPIIFPMESAWFGETTQNGTVIKMEDTKIFKENTFGLKTLFDQGRLFKGEIDGVHLEISNENIQKVLVPGLLR